MDVEKVKTNGLIECYQIVQNYLKQLETEKKEVEKELNEGKKRKRY